MSISLKQAYSACLWLAERKLGIPSTEQRGNWDLTKEGYLAFSRKDLVTSLPNKYFDELSCYTGMINNENDDEFNGLFFIDASNFIDGQLFKFEDQDYFQYFSPFRKSSFLVQNGDENLDMDLNPENIQQIQKLSLLTLNELNHDSCSTENKPRLAEITAHLTLSEKLLNKDFIAKGYRQDIQHKDYLEEKFAECLIETIPIETWTNKTIPNYAESALELGQLRVKELFAQCADGFNKNDPREDYLSKCECWYSHITIENEQDFTNWIMSEVRELFPTPKHATFKPQDKGYLIQFGTDKQITVRNSIGMSLLYKVLKEYRKKSYNIGSGYSAEAFELDTQYDIGINTNTNKQKSKQGNEEKIRNQFLDILSRYFETENLDKKEELKLFTIKLLRQINKISESDILTQDDLKTIFQRDIDWFQKHYDSIKNVIKVDKDEDNKEIDGLRKNLENALDKLKIDCPHFAYYLGSLASKKTLGLGYSKDNQEFYFICKDNIQWDFG